MLFRNQYIAQAFVKEMLLLENLVVEALNAGTSTDGAAELYDEILDRILCRGRDCGVCNGVACEEAVEVDLPDEVLYARALWQGTDIPVSEKVAAAHEYDDSGRCHR